MRIGEVIEASTFSFGVQCYELHNPPPLGSLVKTQEGEVEIYGVVCLAATASLEPGRPPLVRGREEEREEDIFRSHPQLAQLLCTRFQAAVAGHRAAGKLHYYLPPRPPRLHGFAFGAEAEEEREFGNSLDFLPLLLSAGAPGEREEVIAACLRRLSLSRADGQAFLIRAGKELTLLLRGQVTPLGTILRRLRP